MARLDKNHDGKLEVTELPERARHRWAKADTNGDGVIAANEIKRSMRAQADQRFAQADKNGDAKLTESEAGAERWKFLSKADANGDQAVTKEELEQAHQQHKMGLGRPARPAPRPACWRTIRASGQERRWQADQVRGRRGALEVPVSGRRQRRPGSDQRRARAGAPAAQDGRRAGAAWRNSRHRVAGEIRQNGDGRLTPDEVPAPVWEHLGAADANQDNAVTKEEIQAARSQGKLGPRPGKRKPDDRPQAPAK